MNIDWDALKELILSWINIVLNLPGLEDYLLGAGLILTFITVIMPISQWILRRR
jgi:prepilin signal peptidase PulO-like enzyme (type II secretory pathway)